MLGHRWRTAVLALWAISAAAVLTAAGVPAAEATTPGSGCGTAALVAVSTSNNNLYRWTRPTPTSGSFSAATFVGLNWSGIRLTASDSATGDLFAVDTAGNMRLYTWSGSGYSGGGIIGTLWSGFTKLVAAGNGVLYAVAGDGTLHWYHWRGTSGPGATGWDANNGATVGTQWDQFSILASGGNGVLYGVRKSDGALVWYRNLYPGLGRAQWAGGKVVGSGWGTMRAVVGLGGGVLYGVNASGLLLQYTHTGYLSGSATWANSGVGVQIGQGWMSFNRITAGPDSCAPQAPTRQDGVDAPVYFLHGLAVNGWDCGAYWSTAVSRFRTLGWTGPLLTVKYFGADSNCDVTVSNAGLSNSNVDLGRSMAWWIYQHHSVFGQPVQLVGHSMGGIVIRAALTGVAEHWANYPPYLYVTNVATLGSPHNGSVYAGICQVVTSGVCGELAPDSPFLGSLGVNPQSAFGTDWTLIGVADDDMVQGPSAIGVVFSHAGHMEVGHVIWYDKGQFGKPVPVAAPVHMAMVATTGATGYSGWHGEADATNRWGINGEAVGPNQYGYSGFTFLLNGGPAPVDAAFNAVRYWRTR